MELMNKTWFHTNCENEGQQENISESLLGHMSWKLSLGLGV